MLTIIQKQFTDMDNFNYLVFDNEAKIGVIIDASPGVEALAEQAEQIGVRIDKILLTHTHHDHIKGLPLLLEKIPGTPVGVYKTGQEDLGETPRKQPLKDGDRIEIGNGFLEVMHTPGHKPDSVCFYNDEVIFTGDTVFIGGHGRYDLPGGDAHTLEATFEKLRMLPDSLILYPGHAYGPRATSTLGEEKGNY